MSFIFEALKKAERERRAGSEPSPLLEPVAEPSRNRPRGPWVAVAGGGAALAVAAAVLLLRAPAGPPEGPVSSVVAAPAPPPGPAPEREEVSAQVPQPDALPALPSFAPGPAPRLDVARTLSREPPAPWAQGAPPRAEPTPAAPVPAAPPPPVVPQPPAPQAPAAAPAVVPPVPEAPVGPAAAAPAARPAGPVPLLRELSEEVRQKVGRLEISGHVYAEAPGDRFVFLNGRAYRAGDRIAEGVTLAAVTPEGIVIDYGEGRARVEATP